MLIAVLSGERYTFDKSGLILLGFKLYPSAWKAYALPTETPCLLSLREYGLTPSVEAGRAFFTAHKPTRPDLGCLLPGCGVLGLGLLFWPHYWGVRLWCHHQPCSMHSEPNDPLSLQEATHKSLGVTLKMRWWYIHIYIWMYIYIYYKTLIPIKQNNKRLEWLSKIICIHWRGYVNCPPNFKIWPSQRAWQQ